MKVILTKNLDNKGKVNDIIEVSDGYAKNFLFKKNLAIPATKINLIKLQKLLNSEKILKNEESLKMQILKEKIESIVLSFKLRMFNSKISGSISSTRIVNSLIKEYGIKIDKKKIINNGNLTNIGLNFLKIRLNKNLIATLKVIINKMED